MILCSRSTNIFQKPSQIIVAGALHQQVLVVNVLNDEVMPVLGIDLDNDGLDRGIALYQNA